MAAGANQQLVAEKLQPKPEPPKLPLPIPAQPASITPQNLPPVPVATPAVDKPEADGALHISHNPQAYEEPVQPKPEDPRLEQIHIDDQGELQPMADPSTLPGSTMAAQPSVIVPDAFAEPKTAEDMPSAMSLPPVGGPTLSHTSPEPSPVAPAAEVSRPPQTQPLAPVWPPQSQQPPTLSDLEQAVGSAHVQIPAPAPVAPPAVAPAPYNGLADARSAVDGAMNGFGQPVMPPVASLNAMPLASDVQGRIYSDDATIITPDANTAPSAPPPMMPGLGLPPVGGTPATVGAQYTPPPGPNPYTIPPAQ
ncbi:MAG TPA: hypothetical protein VF598_13850, partial [Hymenobacter sp.]